MLFNWIYHLTEVFSLVLFLLCLAHVVIIHTLPPIKQRQLMEHEELEDERTSDDNIQDKKLFSATRLTSFLCSCLYGIILEFIISALLHYCQYSPDFLVKFAQIPVIVGVKWGVVIYCCMETTNRLLGQCRDFGRDKSSVTVDIILFGIQLLVRSVSDALLALTVAIPIELIASYSDMVRWSPGRLQAYQHVLVPPECFFGWFIAVFLFTLPVRLIIYATDKMKLKWSTPALDQVEEEHLKTVDSEFFSEQVHHEEISRSPDTPDSDTESQVPMPSSTNKLTFSKEQRMVLFAVELVLPILTSIGSLSISVILIVLFEMASARAGPATSWALPSVSLGVLILVVSLHLKHIYFRQKQLEEKKYEFVAYLSMAIIPIAIQLWFFIVLLVNRAFVHNAWLIPLSIICMFVSSIPHVIIPLIGHLIRRRQMRFRERI